MDRRLEYLPIDEIQSASSNPKEHRVDDVAASIDRFGYTSPMIIDDRTGRLVVGHGRLASLIARRESGQSAPEGIGTGPDGRWLVPVVRGWASRSDADAAAYLILDNRQTELGGWDHQALADLLDEIGDPDLVALTGWDPAELADLLADGADDDPGDDDPDGIPSPAPEPVSAPGDLWHLGPHRLLCGNANDPGYLDRLLDGFGQPGIVYTDPPYGIHIVANNKVGGSNVVPSSNYIPVAGDDSTEVVADAFRFLTTTYPAARHVWWGANHYAASAGLPDASCWLVWDKENPGSDFADAELAWTNHGGAVRLLRHMWNGMVRASEHGKRVHPTQKPVALAVWAFEQVDPKAERSSVLDAFGGSGSTLIAAHQTGRICAMLEVEPGYVDVICRRYQEYTGIVPVRVSEDGVEHPHDFTAGD